MFNLPISVQLTTPLSFESQLMQEEKNVMVKTERNHKLIDLI